MNVWWWSAVPCNNCIQKGSLTHDWSSWWLKLYLCVCVCFEIVIYTKQQHKTNDIIWWCNDADTAINAKCFEPFFFPWKNYHWHCDSDTFQCFIIITLLWILLLKQCKHCHWIMIALWFYATYIFQLMTEDLIYLELVCTRCKGQFVLNVICKGKSLGITVTLTVKYRWPYAIVVVVQSQITLTTIKSITILAYLTTVH